MARILPGSDFLIVYERGSDWLPDRATGLARLAGSPFGGSHWLLVDTGPSPLSSAVADDSVIFAATNDRDSKQRTDATCNSPGVTHHEIRNGPDIGRSHNPSGSRLLPIDP